MRIEDIVEGGVYRGGKDNRPIVRKVSRIANSVIYTQKGLDGKGSCEVFYLKWFAMWAKERIA